MTYISNYKSKIGELTLASKDKNLIGLWFKNQKYYLSTVSEETVLKEDKVIKKTKKWLDDYFNCEKPRIDKLKLNLIGTDFRLKVWEVLKTIPYGKTMTYKEISEIISPNKKMSAQAIGGAVGHNPISIIIPCHRVIGSNGKLTGYAGGLDNKLYLLKHEKVNINFKNV